MRIRRAIWVVVSATTLVVGLWSGVSAQEASDHNFVGVEDCAGRCHARDNTGNQQAAWESSSHSDAYDTLGTPEAQAIADGLGVGNAQEAGECLVCHTTAYGIDSSHLGENFDVTDGVQCESCHGPGEDYQNMRIMRDSAEAAANGLITPDEGVCTGCHNSDSPTFESFDFAAQSAEIAHPIPAE